MSARSLHRAALLLASLSLVLTACTVDDGTNPNPRDAGTLPPPDTAPRDTGTPPLDSALDGDAGDTTVDAPPDVLPPATLKPFTSPGNSAPPGQILVTASGEVLALGGYAFPPAKDGDPAFVDGWDVRFTHVLVTLDAIRLHDTPDRSPTDQSVVGGLVAELRGPWAVDLHKGGPLAGKGGSDEQAVAIALFANQNKNGGAAFDPTVRYAFGYDAIAATPDARNVDLDAEGLSLYAQMIANRYVVLYAGTATWKGGSACKAGPGATYDFGKLPKTVRFTFGFATPTSYVNCQNPDNDPAPAFAGEEHQRGVQIKASAGVVAQATFHTDHPFWESVVHDSPAHFDMIAGRYAGATSADAVLEDLIGVDLTNVTDRGGGAMAWRSCLPSYTAKAGTLAFDPQSVPVSPGGTPDKALRDLYDLMVYDQSTQGHLNSNGLAFVERHYPSPP